MGSAPSPKSPAVLRPEDRAKLEKAFRRLREASRSYERFLGQELEPGVEPPAHAADEMWAAQQEVEEAERHLWQLRAELLNWVRPSWSPSATQVGDWMSDEDSVYDELGSETET